MVIGLPPLQLQLVVWECKVLLTSGAQIGCQITDLVLILNTRSAVKAFAHGGNFQLGGNISISAGPTGRSSEVGGSNSFLTRFD